MILVRADAQSAQRLEIIFYIEFRLGAVSIAAAPDFRSGDTAVFREVRQKSLSILQQAVIIVAGEKDRIGLVVRDDVVVEVTVIYAGHGPVCPSEVGSHGDHVSLDARRQPCALIFGLEIDCDHPAAVGSHPSLENLDLVKMGEVILHAAHHLVELLDTAPLGHPGPDGKRRAHRLAVEIRTGHRLIEQGK